MPRSLRGYRRRTFAIGFSAMRELSPDQTVRMTQVDYDREMAFLAVRDSTGETVGVVRPGLPSEWPFR